MSMRICLSHLQLWQIPRPKIHLRKSRSSPGLYASPSITEYRSSCFCSQQAQAAARGVLQNKPMVKEIESVGAFQKLPMVMPSVDILSSALKKAKRVSATKGISNIAKRERNKAAKQLDALMKVCPDFICYLFCINTCTLNTQIKADIFRNWQFH